MSVDPTVVAAVAAAVDADPSNPALRAHLASLLVDSGKPGEALDHASTVLVQEPANLDALRVAATAARVLGDDRAAGYQMLLDALGGAAHPPPPPAVDPPTPRPAPVAAPIPAPAPDAREPQPDDEPIPDTLDELLDRWDESEALEEADVGHLARPEISLADVGGLASVKARLEQSFLAPMHNPELRLRFGKSLRGGLLLWGPPGCGKTYIARAVAGELGASFYEVGLADVLDMWIGSSERNLHSVFEVARRNRPCVLFFDEIDALGMKRTQLRGGGSAMRGVVNQLLAELDGVSSDNEGVFVLAATNHPWDIDPALVRPGRIDRSVLVLPPDLEARVAILASHLRARPVGPVDLGRIAAATDGYTGADLALICEQATEVALDDSIRSGVVRDISQADLELALRSVRPSIGSWLETAKNYATYADDTGDYDELLHYLKRRP